MHELRLCQYHLRASCHDKCQMSNVKLMSNVKCQMSNVKCQMSNVKSQKSKVKNKRQKTNYKRQKTNIKCQCQRQGKSVDLVET